MYGISEVISMKIGIMGGTFDPIHNGHLHLARTALTQFDLDQIWFMPNGNPPHKKGNITDKYDRYNMVLLSTVNNDDFIVSDIEIKREKAVLLNDFNKKSPQRRFLRGQLQYMDGKQCVYITQVKSGNGILISISFIFFRKFKLYI
mgnify:CR=1 FL=1